MKTVIFLSLLAIATCVLMLRPPVKTVVQQKICPPCDCETSHTQWMEWWMNNVVAEKLAEQIRKEQIHGK